jgi:hypothetical protein
MGLSFREQALVMADLNVRLAGALDPGWIEQARSGAGRGPGFAPTAVGQIQ